MTLLLGTIILGAFVAGFLSGVVATLIALRGSD